MGGLEWFCRLVLVVCALYGQEFEEFVFNSVMSI